MALDKEQIAEIQKLIGEGVSDALNGDDFKKVLGDSVKGHVTGAVKGLNLEESIGSAVTKALEANKGGGDDEGGDDDKKKKGDSKLEREIEKLKAQAATEKGLRETAETKQKTDALVGAARSALLKAGVPADRIDHALAVLHSASGRLVHDDDGNPGISFKTEFGPEVRAMEKGATDWIGTDEGKHFLPPTNVGGTGDGNSGGKKDFKTTKGKTNYRKVGRKLVEAIGGGTAGQI